MGSYLNPQSKGFQESLNSQIYIDKSGLVARMNALVNTRQKYVCVSRPRRFGKSMAADMLAALLRMPGRIRVRVVREVGDQQRSIL